MDGDESPEQGGSAARVEVNQQAVVQKGALCKIRTYRNVELRSQITKQRWLLVINATLET